MNILAFVIRLYFIILAIVYLLGKRTITSFTYIALITCWILKVTSVNRNSFLIERKSSYGLTIVLPNTNAGRISCVLQRREKNYITISSPLNSTSKDLRMDVIKGSRSVFGIVNWNNIWDVEMPSPAIWNIGKSSIAGISTLFGNNIKKLEMITLQKKMTFKHDDMHIGYVTEKKDEYDKLLHDGFNNIICTNRTKIQDDLYAVSNTAAFHQVRNYLSNP